MFTTDIKDKNLKSSLIFARLCFSNNFIIEGKVYKMTKDLDDNKIIVTNGNDSKILDRFDSIWDKSENDYIISELNKEFKVHEYIRKTYGNSFKTNVPNYNHFIVKFIDTDKYLNYLSIGVKNVEDGLLFEFQRNNLSCNFKTNGTLQASSNIFNHFEKIVETSIDGFNFENIDQFFINGEYVAQLTEKQNYVLLEKKYSKHWGACGRPTNVKMNKKDFTTMIENILTKYFNEPYKI
jgi:hypothetical protein